jgi:outer membrane protein TolC
VAIGLTQAVAGPLAPLSLADTELSDERLQSAEALDKWTDSAAAERPEIAALAQRHQAALAELAAVQKTANPSLYLGASATLAGTQLAAMAFNLGLTAGVTWPISGMWLASPQIAEVRARIRALDGQEQGLRLNVRGELDAARTAIAQARKRRPALATLQQFANQAYDQAKVRYAAGASTMTEVIDAASAVSQARLQLLQADLDEALGVARWRAAMGRLPE